MGPAAAKGSHAGRIKSKHSRPLRLLEPVSVGQTRELVSRLIVSQRFAKNASEKRKGPQSMHFGRQHFVHSTSAERKWVSTPRALIILLATLVARYSSAIRLAGTKLVLSSPKRTSKLADCRRADPLGSRSRLKSSAPGDTPLKLEPMKSAEPQRKRSQYESPKSGPLGAKQRTRSINQSVFAGRVDGQAAKAASSTGFPEQPNCGQSEGGPNCCRIVSDFQSDKALEEMVILAGVASGSAERSQGNCSVETKASRVHHRSAARGDGAAQGEQLMGELGASTPCNHSGGSIERQLHDDADAAHATGEQVSGEHFLRPAPQHVARGAVRNVRSAPLMRARRYLLSCTLVACALAAGSLAQLNDTRVGSASNSTNTTQGYLERKNFGQRLMDAAGNSSILARTLRHLNAWTGPNPMKTHNSSAALRHDYETTQIKASSGSSSLAGSARPNLSLDTWARLINLKNVPLVNQLVSLAPNESSAPRLATWSHNFAPPSANVSLRPGSLRRAAQPTSSMVPFSNDSAQESLSIGIVIRPSEPNGTYISAPPSNGTGEAGPDLQLQPGEPLVADSHDWQSSHDIEQVIYVGANKEADGRQRETQGASSERLGEHKHAAEANERLKGHAELGHYSKMRHGAHEQAADSKKGAKGELKKLVDLGHNKHGWKNVYHKEEYAQHQKFHDVFQNKDWLDQQTNEGQRHKSNTGGAYNESLDRSHVDRDKHASKYDYRKGTDWRRSEEEGERGQAAQMNELDHETEHIPARKAGPEQRQHASHIAGSSNVNSIHRSRRPVEADEEAGGGGGDSELAGARADDEAVLEQMKTRLEHLSAQHGDLPPAERRPRPMALQASRLAAGNEYELVSPTKQTNTDWPTSAKSSAEPSDQYKNIDKSNNYDLASVGLPPTATAATTSANRTVGQQHRGLAPHPVSRATARPDGEPNYGFPMNKTILIERDSLFASRGDGPDRQDYRLQRHQHEDDDSEDAQLTGADDAPPAPYRPNQHWPPTDTGSSRFNKSGQPRASEDKRNELRLKLELDLGKLSSSSGSGGSSSRLEGGRRNSTALANSLGQPIGEPGGRGRSRDPESYELNEHEVDDEPRRQPAGTRPRDQSESPAKSAPQANPWPGAHRSESIEKQPRYRQRDSITLAKVVGGQQRFQPAPVQQAHKMASASEAAKAGWQPRQATSFGISNSSRGLSQMLPDRPIFVKHLEMNGSIMLGAANTNAANNIDDLIHQAGLANKTMAPFYQEPDQHYPIHFGEDLTVETSLNAETGFNADHQQNGATHLLDHHEQRPAPVARHKEYLVTLAHERDHDHDHDHHTAAGSVQQASHLQGGHADRYSQSLAEIGEPELELDEPHMPNGEPSVVFEAAASTLHQNDARLVPGSFGNHYELPPSASLDRPPLSRLNEEDELALMSQHQLQHSGFGYNNEAADNDGRLFMLDSENNIMSSPPSSALTKHRQLAPSPLQQLLQQQHLRPLQTAAYLSAMASQRRPMIASLRDHMELLPIGLFRLGSLNYANLLMNQQLEQQRQQQQQQQANFGYGKVKAQRAPSVGPLQGAPSLMGAASAPLSRWLRLPRVLESQIKKQRQLLAGDPLQWRPPVGKPPPSVLNGLDLTSDLSRLPSRLMAPVESARSQYQSQEAAKHGEAQVYNNLIPITNSHPLQADIDPMQIGFSHYKVAHSAAVSSFHNDSTGSSTKPNLGVGSKFKHLQADKAAVNHKPDSEYSAVTPNRDGKRPQHKRQAQMSGAAIGQSNHRYHESGSMKTKRANTMLVSGANRPMIMIRDDRFRGGGGGGAVGLISELGGMAAVVPIARQASPIIVKPSESRLSLNYTSPRAGLARAYGESWSQLRLSQMTTAPAPATLQPANAHSKAVSRDGKKLISFGQKMMDNLKSRLNG